MGPEANRPLEPRLTPSEERQQPAPPSGFEPALPGKVAEWFAANRASIPERLRANALRRQREAFFAALPGDVRAEFAAATLLGTEEADEALAVLQARYGHFSSWPDHVGETPGCRRAGFATLADTVGFVLEGGDRAPAQVLLGPGYGVVLMVSARLFLDRLPTLVPTLRPTGRWAVWSPSGDWGRHASWCYGFPPGSTEGPERHFWQVYRWPD
jgi:hypothetical protein